MDEGHVSTSTTAYGTLSAIIGLAGRCMTLTAATAPSPLDGRHSMSVLRQCGHVARGYQNGLPQARQRLSAMGR